MLLTQLIPPRSIAHKRLVAKFRKWIEEPHKSTSEACIVFVIGGRGCGKSTIASGLMLAGVDETKSNAVVFRMDRRDIRHSVYVQMFCTLDMLGQKEKWHSSFAPLALSSEREGRIIFKSKDEKRWDNFRLGVLPIPNKRFFWIEDADELPSAADLQRLIEILTETSENPFVVVTFNPPPYERHWANRLVNRKDIKKNVFFLNYKNLEKDMLGEPFFRSANLLKKNYTKAYQHEYMGKPVKK